MGGGGGKGGGRWGREGGGRGLSQVSVTKAKITRSESSENM